MRSETPEKQHKEALFDLPCACQDLRRATRVVTKIYDQELAMAGIEITQFGMLIERSFHEGWRAVERASRAREGLHIKLEYVVHTLPHLQHDRCASFAGLNSIAARIVKENFLTADLNKDRGKVAWNTEQRRGFRHHNPGGSEAAARRNTTASAIGVLAINLLSCARGSWRVSDQNDLKYS